MCLASLAMQAAKVKDANEEGAWKRRIAYVEPYDTLEEAIDRQKFEKRVKKIFVVSGPPSGPIPFITLRGEVVTLDHTLANDPRIASHFARRGPEMWQDLQRNKEYLT